MTEYRGISKETRTKCSTPTYERIKQLWALGLSPFVISDTINLELGDIEVFEITQELVKRIIGENMEDFKEARANLGLQCQNEIRSHVAMMFNKVRDKENRLVDVFTAKLEVVLNQLSDLDIDEKDGEGNYKNTSRFFVLYEMADKLQSKISKIVGSDAMREIEIFKQKLELKAKLENNNGLIPEYTKGNTVEVGVNFV